MTARTVLRWPMMGGLSWQAPPATRCLLTPGDDGYQVTTLAGVPGQSGNQDGPANEALFNSPHGVIWEAGGSVLVVDIDASIRRIKDGEVTTLATAADSKMVMPIDMMPAVDGSYLIADAGIQKAIRWSPCEEGEVLARNRTGDAARY